MTNIEIEPGMHPITAEESDEVFSKIRSGDVDTHFWNGNVARRIGAYQPQVISVDGILPTMKDYDSEIEKEYKLVLWGLLPAKPSELNDKGEVYVVAGDSVYGHPDSNNFSGKWLRTLTIAGLACGGYMGATAYHDLHRPAIEQESMGTVYNWEVDERNAEKKKDEQERLTRRTFIGGMGALLGFGVYTTSRFAAYSNFGFAKDGFSAASDKTGELSLDRLIDADNSLTYVDGRTALLISKLKDSFSFLNLYDADASGAVILGEAHLPKASDLLDSPTLRDEYIRKHARLLVENARKDKGYFSDTSTPAERAAHVIDVHRRVEIFRVTDLDPETPPHQVLDEISRSVQLVHKFDSPSVVAATEGVLKIPRK